MEEYTPPGHGGGAFHCPNCGVYAQQGWIMELNGTYSIPGIANPAHRVQNFSAALCTSCRVESLWLSARMIYPLTATAPRAHADMPEEEGIRADYEEARDILARSPRGAAALLRLVIQKLCVYLLEKGEYIDKDIASLVKKGLPVRIQQALDIVRVVGNESVHPGTMDLKDDAETAGRLFGLVNLIVEDRISNPKHVEEMYLSLPEGKREAIEKRDGRT